MTYSQKLKDPRWQKKRLQILERDNWKCKGCLDSERTLHVHHLSYEKGKEPWEYDDLNFITLCEECHNKYHIIMKNSKEKIIIGALFVDIVNFPHDISKYVNGSNYELLEVVRQRKIEFYEMAKDFNVKFKKYIAENVFEIYGHFHPYPIEK